MNGAILAAGAAIVALVWGLFRKAPTSLRSQLRPSAPDPARDCGLQPGDLERARAWVTELHGANTPTDVGLRITPHRGPWPDYATRADCFYRRTRAQKQLTRVDTP